MPLSYSDLVKPELLSQPVYQPGKPIEDVARELGLDPASISKLASNENPLGASPKAIAVAKAALDEVALYPDGGCFELKQVLAEKWGLSPEQFIIGNGSNEVLELVGHALIGPGDEAVMGKGAFIVYKLVTLLFGGKPVEVPMVDHRHDLKAMAEAVTDRTKVVFLPSPDNPSGSANEESEIVALIESLPENVIFVFDEAYSEYLDKAPDLRPLIAAGKRVFCTRTFSKIYGLAGLRIGYGYGDPELVGLLNRAREPFNANAIAQAAAIESLKDVEWVAKCREANAAGLRQLEVGFEGLGLEYVKGFGNFVTVKVGNGGEVFQSLQAKGVIVRPLAPYGLAEWVRISVGTVEENERALRELGSALGDV
ncbi:MAG: histidinol-phosphate transaminase [Verrucomicrobiota bacterium]